MFFVFLFLAPVFTCNQAKFRRGQVTPPYRLFYCWLPTIKRSVGNGLDRSESFRGEHHNKFWLVVCRIFWRPFEGSCLRSRLKGGSTRRAQKFMLPTIHGGQRALRPQARFGGQPGLKIPAFRPEMATLPFIFPSTVPCLPPAHNISRKSSPFPTLPQGSFQH